LQLPQPTSNTGYDFVIDFNTDTSGNKQTSGMLQKKLGWMLGYRQASYSNQSAYVSEGVLDMSGFKYLYLVVNDFNNNVNNSFYGIFQNSLLNENVLAHLSILAPFFSTKRPGV
jgi:hypothetical protein